MEPLGRIDCHKSSGKFFLKGEKEGGKQGGRVVGSCDRQPENERQKTNHSRISGQPPGQDAVPKSIPFAVGFFRKGDRAGSNGLRSIYDAGYDSVL